MKKRKWTIGALILILLLFIIWNLVWYFTIATTYNQLTENMSKDQHGDFFLEKDEYSYYVDKPIYLSWSGNLTITDLKSDNSVIIWPSFLDDNYEYGVLVHIGGEASVGITVDEELKPIESDPDSEKIINDHKSELELLMSEAKRFWNL